VFVNFIGILFRNLIIWVKKKKIKKNRIYQVKVRESDKFCWSCIKIHLFCPLVILELFSRFSTLPLRSNSSDWVKKPSGCNFSVIQKSTACFCHTQKTLSSTKKNIMYKSYFSCLTQFLLQLLRWSNTTSAVNHH
jgi:hypothetical protein